MTIAEILAALGVTATAASGVSVAIVRACSRRADAHDERDSAREDRVAKLERALDAQREELRALVALRLDDQDECQRVLREQIGAAKAECGSQIAAVEARHDRQLEEIMRSLVRAGSLREDDTGVRHVEDVIRRGRQRRTTPPQDTRYVDPDDT